MQTVLFLVTTAEYFISHRLELAVFLTQNNYRVAVATTCTEEEKKAIESNDIKVFSLTHLSRKSLNPFKEYLAVREIKSILNEYKPDFLHNVALKPILYGNLANKNPKTKVINALGGLGYLFTQGSGLKRTLLKKFIIPLYKKALLPNPLIVQNQDDANFLIEQGFAKEENIHLIRGAGVNLEKFKYTNTPNNEICKVVVGCRMLKDKGILEIIKAAKQLKEKSYPIEVHFYGDIDVHNPSCISKEELQKWHDDKIIHWHGKAENMIEAYKTADIALLASYREGMPRTLLEAAATGRPLITTDVPGCRDLIVDNGILIPPKDSEAIYNAIVELYEDKEKRLKMSRNSHKVVYKTFSNPVIFKQTLEVYNNLCS